VALTSPSEVLTLPNIKYVQFLQSWQGGEYKNKRYGQAFYDHFDLWRQRDQRALITIYEADGEAAQQRISALIRFQ
jgi:hypothetical protein